MISDEDYFDFCGFSACGYHRYSVPLLLEFLLAGGTPHALDVASQKIETIDKVMGSPAGHAADPAVFQKSMKDALK